MDLNEALESTGLYNKETTMVFLEIMPIVKAESKFDMIKVIKDPS